MKKTSDLSSIGLDAIFAPLTPAEFLAGLWNQSAIHLSGGGGRFSELMGWDSLAQLLERCPLEPPRIGLKRNGKSISEELYLKCANVATIDAGALSLLLDQGATLLVNFVDELEPKIASIADAIAEMLSGYVWVNLYASWRTERGLDLHWDSHDVIVLQIAGCKHWTVYPPTRVNPLKGDKFEPPTPDLEPAWSGPVQEGDVLYIPRGWSHVAVPTGDPSLHLTFGISQPTGSDYLRWVSDQLVEKPKIRSAIPASNHNGEQDAWLIELRHAVDAAIDIRSTNAFLSFEAASKLARPRLTLPKFARSQPDGWTGETAVRLAATRRLDVQEHADGRVTIRSAGRELQCSPALAPALRSLSSAQPTQLSKIEKGLHPSAISELKRTLAIMMQLGLLFTETPEEEGHSF